MKLLVLIFTFCFGVIDSSTLPPEKYESGNNCQTVEIEPTYYNPDGDETRTKISNEESPCQGKDLRECTEEIENTLPLTSPLQPEMDILENIPSTPNYFYGYQRPQRAFDWNTQYQLNNLPGFRGVPYGGIKYYVHPSMYTSFNPPPAYLPPAVPAYARRSIPELHRQLYQRPARVIRSRVEDDFLSELQHMAMMNNILPTMSIPFMRSSYNGYAQYGVPSAGGSTAVFPAGTTGCAIPLLFSCSPKITRGIVAKPLPSDYSQSVSPVASSYEYRKPDWNKEDIAEIKSDVSQNDLFLNDGLKLSNDNYGNDKKQPVMNAIDRALQSKHVGGEKHAVSEKSHVEGVRPAHMTS